MLSISMSYQFVRRITDLARCLQIRGYLRGNWRIKANAVVSAITEDGFVSDEKKAKIAREITRIHTTVMKVPNNFVRVVFLSYRKGSGFAAGEKASTAALNCVLRSSHTDEDKTEMLKQLWSMFQKLIGIPTDQLANAIAKSSSEEFRRR